jgi:hypothetical protein
MAYELIRFSLADPYLQRLKEMTPEGESMHVILKNIACEALIPSKDLSKETPVDPSELEAITERLSALEQEVGATGVEAINKRLSSLEQEVGFLLHWLKTFSEADRLSVLENEVGNGFIAYKELRDALDKFQLQIQGSYAIAEKCTELIKDQEARLKALEEAPGRSPSSKQPKRDSNGQFIKKGL